MSKRHVCLFIMRATGIVLSLSVLSWLVNLEKEMKNFPSYKDPWTQNIPQLHEISHKMGVVEMF